MDAAEEKPTSSEEIVRLRSEVEDLRRQVAQERSARSERVRRVAGATLTVLAVLVTTLALLAVWTFRTFTDSDLFVERIGSIAEQPEVATAIGEVAAAQLADALELEERIADALPDELSVVSGPLATAAQNSLARGTTVLVQSDQFQQAWDTALRQGHALSIAILEGSDLEAVQNSDGVVVLNLTPVVNALVGQASALLSDLLDREVTAPTVTEDTIDATIAALEDRLDVDLPADFGQVVLFEAPDLAAAQQAYQAARAAVWLAPIAAAVLIGMAVAVSTRRLRTGMWIVVGTALALLVVAITLQPLQTSILDRVADESLAGAVAATFDTVLGSLLRGIVVIVVLGVLAAAALVLTGHGRTAQAGRDALERAPSLASTHRAAFLLAGALVAVLVLALIPGRSWSQLLVVLLLYAGYALAVLLAHDRQPVSDQGPVPDQVAR